MSLFCCCCEGQDCQLQPTVQSFIPPSDDKSSCGSKAPVGSEMICYGRSVTGCPSCASVPPLQINEKLCIAVNTALLPSNITFLSPAHCCDPLRAQQGLRDNSLVTSPSHLWLAVTKQFSGRRRQSNHDGLGQGKGYSLPKLRQQ